MVSILVPLLAAFFFALILTPPIRDLALTRRWVDQPDDSRKTHTHPCPRLGGVPILLAVIAAFAMRPLSAPLWHGAAPSSFRAWEAAAAVGIIFMIGLLDDFRSLKPWQKLTGEIAAAVVIVLAGIRIDHIGPVAIPVPWRTVLTVVWLVGCTNAFNLIDGADGLAAGLGLIASAAVFAAAITQGDPVPALVAAILAGALTGFLRFNFHRASIFLGDCGSLLIGFILAASAVLWSQREHSLLAAAAPAIAFGVPLFDTAISILRRFLRRQPIFSADRDHIHHRLLDRGFTTRQLVALLYFAAIALAVLALIESTARATGQIVVFAVFGAMVFAAIAYLRYREFGLAARVLRQNDMRAAVKSHLALGRCEDALHEAASAVECWEAVRVASRELGFAGVALCLGGHVFRDRPGAPLPHWTLHIPLSGPDYLRFTCVISSPRPAIIAPLADSLHRILLAKAAQFAPDPQQVQSRTARMLAKRRMRTKAIARLAASAGLSESVVEQEPS